MEGFHRYSHIANYYIIFMVNCTNNNISIIPIVILVPVSISAEKINSLWWVIRDSTANAKTTKLYLCICVKSRNFGNLLLAKFIEHLLQLCNYTTIPVVHKYNGVVATVKSFSMYKCHSKAAYAVIAVLYNTILWKIFEAENFQGFSVSLIDFMN